MGQDLNLDPPEYEAGIANHLTEMSKYLVYSSRNISVYE
jgi:hypothetical protein